MKAQGLDQTAAYRKKQRRPRKTQGRNPTLSMALGGTVDGKLAEALNLLGAIDPSEDPARTWDCDVVGAVRSKASGKVKVAVIWDGEVDKGKWIPLSDLVDVDPGNPDPNPCDIWFGSHPNAQCSGIASSVLQNSDVE